MALANLILETGQQQANYGAAVGQSLVALGQQVGQQLATREYQRQAQAALPALQQTYSSALDKIEAGNLTEGYRDILNAQFQFGATQNPFLAKINEGAAKVAENAAGAYMKQYQAQMQYGGRGGGGGGTTTGRGTSLLEMFSGGTGGGVDANVGGVADFIDQEAADQLPQGEASAGTTGNWSFQVGGYERPTKEIETTANQEFEKYSSGDVTEQESYRTSVMSPQTPQGTEFVEQPGLNRFKGFERVTGVFVPREKTIDFPEYSVRKGETGAISENIKFGKKTINEKQRVKAEELAYNDLPTAISRISENQSLEKYFLENSPETLDIGSKKDESGQQSFFIGVRGKENSYMPIEQDDYLAATVIRRLPSSSKTLGAPLAITAVQETAEAPAAPTAGATQTRLSLEEIARGGAAQPAAPTAAAPVRELTLEERIAAKTTTAAPTRTATREQIAGARAGQVRQQRSTLESEKTRLERSLYETPRAGGGRKLKRGLTAQDPDVKAALDRIAAINKQLEAL